MFADWPYVVFLQARARHGDIGPRKTCQASLLQSSMHSTPNQEDKKCRAPLGLVRFFIRNGTYVYVREDFLTLFCCSNLRPYRKCIVRHRDTTRKIDVKEELRSPLDPIFDRACCEMSSRACFSPPFSKMETKESNSCSDKCLNCTCGTLSTNQ